MSLPRTARVTLCARVRSAPRWSPSSPGAARAATAAGRPPRPRPRAPPRRARCPDRDEGRRARRQGAAEHRRRRQARVRHATRRTRRTSSTRPTTTPRSSAWTSTWAPPSRRSSGSTAEFQNSAFPGIIPGIQAGKYELGMSSFIDQPRAACRPSTWSATSARAPASRSSRATPTRSTRTTCAARPSPSRPARPRSTTSTKRNQACTAAGKPAIQVTELQAADRRQPGAHVGPGRRVPRRLADRRLRRQDHRRCRRGRRPALRHRAVRHRAQQGPGRLRGRHPGRGPVADGRRHLQGDPRQVERRRRRDPKSEINPSADDGRTEGGTRPRRAGNRTDRGDSAVSSLRKTTRPRPAAPPRAGADQGRAGPAPGAVGRDRGARRARGHARAHGADQRRLPLGRRRPSTCSPRRCSTGCRTRSS